MINSFSVFLLKKNLNDNTCLDFIHIHNVIEQSTNDHIQTITLISITVNYQYSKFILPS